MLFLKNLFTKNMIASSNALLLPDSLIDYNSLYR
jgi:hypothetical protein